MTNRLLLALSNDAAQLVLGVLDLLDHAVILRRKEVRVEEK